MEEKGPPRNSGFGPGNDYTEVHDGRGSIKEESDQTGGAEL